MPDGSGHLAHPTGAALSAYDVVAVPVLLHRGGAVLHANPSMLRLLGCPQEEARTLDVMSLVIAEDRDALHEHLQACLSPDAQEPPAQAYTLESRQGVRRRVEWTSRACAIEGRHTLVVTCQDLSDMQFVQDSLQQLSQMLHQIIEGGPIPTFVIGVDHRVTHWNRACERLTGVSAMEMRGAEGAWRGFWTSPRALLADLIVDEAPEDLLRSTYADGDARQIEGGDGAWEVEQFFPQLGPEGRWVHFTAVPLRDTAGRIIGAIETLLDVTERRQAEEALRQHRNELELRVQERSAELRGTLHQLEAFMANAPVGVARTRGRASSTTTARWPRSWAGRTIGRRRTRPSSSAPARNSSGCASAPPRCC